MPAYIVTQLLLKQVIKRLLQTLINSYKEIRSPDDITLAWCDLQWIHPKYATNVYKTFYFL